MKKNWTIRLLAGVAAGAMAFSMVGCGSSKDNSKNGGKEKFIVGFDAAFPPYGYQDENGEFVAFGDKMKLYFKLDHFTGCRAGLFVFSTKESGGEAGFHSI